MRPAVLAGSPPAPGIFRAYTSGRAGVISMWQVISGSFSFTRTSLPRARSVSNRFRPTNARSPSCVAETICRCAWRARQTNQNVAARFRPRPPRKWRPYRAPRDAPRRNTRRRARARRVRRLHRSKRPHPANQEPIARLLDSLHRDPLQPASQRHKELAKEKSAIAAFEPQFVIVDNNDRFAHSKFSDFTRALNFSKLYQMAAQCMSSGEPASHSLLPSCLRQYILTCLIAITQRIQQILARDFAPSAGLESASLLSWSEMTCSARNFLLPNAPVLHPIQLTWAYGGYDVEPA